MLEAETQQDQLEIISDQSIQISLDGKMSPTMEAPRVPPRAGFPSTCANPPLEPQAVAHNAYAVLSDGPVPFACFVREVMSQLSDRCVRRLGARLPPVKRGTE